MDAPMTPFDRLVPDKDQSEYHWFGITTTFQCDQCDQTHQREHTYFLGERFCPNPDCTCRSLILDVFRMDGTTAVSIANTLIDLDEFHVSIDTWRNVTLKTIADARALQHVTRHLSSDAAVLDKFERHWQEVRVAVAVRHKRQRQKQRARYRTGIRR